MPGEAAVKDVPGSRKRKMLEASPEFLRPALGFGIDAVRAGRLVARNTGAALARRTLPLVQRVSPASADRLRASGWLWQPGFSYHQLNRLYDDTVDPFRFETNPYEAGKYAHTLRLLSTRSYGAALEVGAAEGIFTEMLAPLCESVVAIDVADAAVERAKERLARFDNVDVVLAALPARWPEGRWDLIVASDVLYYFPKDVLIGVAEEFGARLDPGGTLIAVHYLGHFGQSMGGHDVHDLLREHTGLEFEYEETVEGVGPSEAGYTVIILRKPSGETGAGTR